MSFKLQKIGLKTCPKNEIQIGVSIKIRVLQPRDKVAIANTHHEGPKLAHL